MDSQFSVRDHHEHRNDTEAFAPVPLRRGGTPIKAPKTASSAGGSGWYHDAAIEAVRRETIETRCHPVHW